MLEDEPHGVAHEARLERAMHPIVLPTLNESAAHKQVWVGEQALISWRETSGLDDVARRRFRDLAPCPEPPRLQHGFNVPLKLGGRLFLESRELRARYVHESQRLIYHSAPLLGHIAMPNAWPHACVAVPLQALRNALPIGERRL